MSRKILVLFVVILAAVVVMTGCGGNDNKNKEADKAIAIVNGIDVMQSEFDALLEQVKQNYTQDGVDLESEEGQQLIKDLEPQVMDTLIERELLLQTANEQGVVVSDEDVDAEIAGIKSQYPEDEFNEVLEGLNITLEQIEADISNQLKIEQYILSRAGDIVVTEEEMREYYDLIAAQNEEAPQTDEEGEIMKLPEYEEVKSEIEAGLKQEKIQSARVGIVEKIKSESEIEIL